MPPKPETVNEMWSSYAEAIQLDLFDDTAKRNMELSFWAGVLAMLSNMTDRLTMLPEAEGVKLISGWQAEIEAFKAEVLRRAKIELKQAEYTCAHCDGVVIIVGRNAICKKCGQTDKLVKK